MARNVLYPLYQLGGPQLRVFRTNFFIQLVRPGTVQPEDTVQFRIPMEMTRVDLRNYLERIYNVPVAAVRTRVQHGSNRKRDHRNVRIKKPDYKVAYVQLVLRQRGSRGNQAPWKEALSSHHLDSCQEVGSADRKAAATQPQPGHSWGPGMSRGPGAVGIPSPPRFPPAQEAASCHLVTQLSPT